MLHEELIALAQHVQAQQAESQTVEVKAAHEGCPTKLRDTLSSFSNQNSGGTLLFGLDEQQQFQTVGVYDVQDLQKKVTEQCNQMCPPVRALFTTVQYQDQWICSAEIPAIPYAERPCYYSGAGIQNGSYIRVGDADRHMTDYEIYCYEAYRNHLHDDERTVERASVDFLDQSLLHTFLMERRASRPQFSRMTDEQAMEMLSITRNGTVTLAGLLNFCQYPQGFFPELGITAIVVPGTEIGDLSVDGARFLDNKRIEGTISNMFSEAMSFCIRNMKTATVIDHNTGQRTDRTEYPVSAIREAILNALIHRDYSVHTEGTPIQIDFFSDRLEIHSPGSLYGRMTVEDLGIAHPDARNPVLAVMTESLTEAEHRYSGIPTMRRAMQDAGLPAPVFINRQNEFVVILYNTPTIKAPEPAKRLSEDASLEVQLLTFCQTPRSRKEIADFLGINTVYHANKKYIQPLVQQGLLRLSIPEKPQSRNQRYTAVNP